MGKTNEGWEMSKKETDFFPSFERGVFHGKVVNAVWLGVGRPGPPVLPLLSTTRLFLQNAVHVVTPILYVLWKRKGVSSRWYLLVP